ncbi:MAG: glycosyl hydrolase, partial [Pedobacter sp.]
NENNTLPLRKDLKKIVVLGPNADNAISILGNYNGNPTTLSTVLNGIKQKVGKNTQVVYEKAINFTSANMLVFQDVASQCSFDGKQGFKAEYFNNVKLAGSPIAVRQEAKVNHFWQEGENVIGNLAANDFSARYTTNFKANASQKLAFELEADNGYRLILNGKIVLDEWVNKKKEIKRFELTTKKDTVYNLVVEFWQGDGQSSVRMDVGNYVQTDFDALVAKHQDADAFIFAGGISPQLEGESMKVDDPGFTGGDRTSILLPAVQTALMKALKTSGKPVVFVMMTGSAIATPWESENIPAILNTWYGGQSAGTATADILFGDYNPSGRLPVTFYKSDSDLADFNDYNMENRTYRYFKNKPLYGFGYGLSYTTFSYAKQNIPTKVVRGKNVPVTVMVTNKGKMAGDEVAQLYIVNQDKNIKTSIKALKGFERISLKAGETKVVKFLLTPDDLSYIDANGVKQRFKGNLQITIGGSQPDEPNQTSGNVLKSIININ